MNLRIASRSIASLSMTLLVALLLAACQKPATDAVAVDATAAPVPEAATAPAAPLADEPALDPSAAASADASAQVPAEAPATAPAETAAAAMPTNPAVSFATEGEHYSLIPGGQPFEPLNGRIEVVEVFNYVCPACAMFQPLVNNWKARLPGDVRFTYVPAAFGGNWDPYVRSYYAAEAMGIAEKSHDGIFKAIHVDRTLKGERGTDSAEDVAQAYAQFGADPAKFASTMASFAVNAKFGRAKQFITAQRVNSTPTLIVNGRYKILGRSWEELLQNTDRTIAQVRAGG